MLLLLVVLCVPYFLICVVSRSDFMLLVVCLIAVRCYLFLFVFVRGVSVDDFRLADLF